MADLEAIEQAAANWRADYAEPLIAAVRPGDPFVADSATAERGKVEFDRIRELFDAQNDHLTTIRSDGLAELKHAQNWRNGLLVAILLVFIATAILLAIADPKRRHPAAGGARRDVPAYQQGQLRREHRHAGAQRHSRDRG